MLLKFEDDISQKKFAILTDNTSLKFFDSQSNLAIQQAQWQGFLSLSFTILPKPRNVVADALGCRVYLYTMSFVTCNNLV